MGCREGSKVRVHPRNQKNEFVRVNGWTRPIHYLQIVAWVVLLVTALVYFAVVAASVSRSWKPAAYVCVGILYITHVIANFIATTKNPADVNAKIQMKQNHQIPDFDRAKHEHVIENEYCHLCETYVSKTSKHCRACNKCVADFDHHCLWLNNCVGGLTYRYFLAAIASAFLGSLIIAAVSLFVFINSFLGFQLLDKQVWWKTVSSTLFQVIMGILILLCLICSILLGQLLFFHLYLIRRGLTTYEYIQNSRSKKAQKQGKVNSVVNVSADENVGPCATPPSIIDTVVTSTNEGASVVKASRALTENTSKLDIGNKNSYDAMLRSTPNTIVTDNSVTPNREDKTSPSNSEFTNAAFSTDEPKNVNMNSNVVHATRTSGNGVLNHGSSLGELQSWDSAPKSVDTPDQTYPQTTTGDLNGSLYKNSNKAKDGPSRPLPSAGKSENDPIMTRRKKRTRGSKKNQMHLDDGVTRPLPVLPENSNPSMAHVGLRKKILLPPLRSSAEWASSSEDLQSIIPSQRKLPSITPSSSVNSFVSYASGNITSNHHSGRPQA